MGRRGAAAARGGPSAVVWAARAAAFSFASRASTCDKNRPRVDATIVLTGRARWHKLVQNCAAASYERHIAPRSLPERCRALHASRARGEAAMPRPATRAQCARSLPAAPTADAAQDASLAPPTPPDAAAEDAISELPDVLLHILLRALCAAGRASPKAAEESALALVRLASCSSHLRRAVAALDDDAWLVRAARVRVRDCALFCIAFNCAF